MLRIKECKALARRTLLGRYGTVIGASLLNTAAGCVMWLLTAAAVIFTVSRAGLLNWIGVPFLNASFSFAGVTIGVMLALALLIISMIFPSVMELGCRRLMLNICRGRRYSVMDVFSGFRGSSHPVGYVVAGIILYLITFILNSLPRVVDFTTALIFGSETMPAMLSTVIAYAVCIVLNLYFIVSFMLVKTIMADHPEYGIAKSFARSRQLMKGRKGKGFWLLYLSFILWLLLAAVCPPAILWISPYIMCTGVIFYMDADGSLWQLQGSEEYTDSRSSNETGSTDNSCNAEGCSNETSTADTDTVPSENEAPSETDPADDAENEPDMTENSYSDTDSAAAASSSEEATYKADENVETLEKDSQKPDYPDTSQASE